MSFASLPVELIDWICKYCDHPSLKALRLTCRGLCNVADDYLFKDVVVYMNKPSMEHCRRAANEPRYAKSIKWLWFQSDIPQHLEFDQWKKNWERSEFTHRYVSAQVPDMGELSKAYMNVQREEGGDKKQRYKEELDKIHARIEKRANEAPKKEFTERNLRHRYRHYRKLVRDVDSMLVGGEIHDSLVALFKNCGTNLEAVDFTMGHEIRPSTPEKNKVFQYGLVCPHNDNSDEYEDSVAVFAALLRAAAEAEYAPISLRLGGLSHFIFDDPDATDDFEGFIRNLELLKWDLPSPFNDDGDGPDWDAVEGMVDDLGTGCFYDLVKNAPNLRTLWLTMPYHERPCIMPRLDLLVGDHVWAYLKDFAISSVATWSDDLPEFLLRHAETLEFVDLEEIELLDGNWPECFAEFAGKLPKLKRFDLRGQFSYPEDEHGYEFYWFGHMSSSHATEYGKKMSEYIMTPGAEFPDVPDVREGSWYDASDAETVQDVEDEDLSEVDEELIERLEADMAT